MDPTRIEAAPCESARYALRERSGGRRFETFTAAHVGLLVIFAAWAYGGGVAWAQISLSWLATAGVALTCLALLFPQLRQSSAPGPLLTLLPFGLFNVVVLCSLFNPNHRELWDGSGLVFARDANLPLWELLPSTARPDVTWRALWFFDAVYLSCFNLILFVRRRRIMRVLLLVLAGNALVLAVFGTVQKLAGAKGLFFGATATVQPQFFASFVYHNHWGAFTLLMTAAALALAFHFGRRQKWRDFWHSPAPLWFVAVLFLATSIPLSTSRSSTLLLLLLVGLAIVVRTRELVAVRRRCAQPVIRPLLIAAVALALAGSFIYVLAEPAIARRVAQTRAEVSDMHAKGDYLPRSVLYRDTWRLARERLSYGWGMGSYPTAFYHVNSQHFSSNGPNRLFHDAHSDWLQSIAEVGVVGTAALVLCGIVPLFRMRAALRRGSPMTILLLTGCGLVALYASLEFPFGNPAVVVAFWTCFFGALQYSAAARPSAKLSSANSS